MKIAFLTFGCRLNQAEAAEHEAAMARLGAQSVPQEEADVLCVHSCAVTEPAVHEVCKTLRAFRRKHPKTRVILSGCAATLVPKELADLALPHAEKAQWLAHVSNFLGLQEAVPAVELPRHKTRAMLILQDGCDRFCAYCIVPHLRGAPVSVPMAQLLKAAEARFAEGFQEIVLTGCHIALYKDPETGADFVELLRRLCDVPGEGRFRIGSLEPCTIDDFALLKLMKAQRGRLCPFLHLPIQTGSDALLSAMGRTYQAQEVRALLETFAATFPQGGLSADWIVGLPGETEADAEATCAMVRDFPFTGGHLFPYSRRPGTPAADFPNQVPQHLIKARMERLRAMLAERQAKTLETLLGQSLTVIPEQFREGHWEGWSEQRIRCHVPPPAERGQPLVFTPTQRCGAILS